MSCFVSCIPIYYCNSTAFLKSSQNRKNTKQHHKTTSFRFFLEQRQGQINDFTARGLAYVSFFVKNLLKQL